MANQISLSHSHNAITTSTRPSSNTSTDSKSMKTVNHHNRFRVGQNFTTISYRLYPTEEQKEILNKWLSVSRDIYNNIICSAYDYNAPKEARIYSFCSSNYFFNEIEFYKYWYKQLLPIRQVLGKTINYPSILLSSIIKQASYDIYNSLSFTNSITRLRLVRKEAKKLRKLVKAYYSKKKGRNRRKYKKELKRQILEQKNKLYKAALYKKPQYKARHDYKSSIVLYGHTIKILNGAIKLPKIKEPVSAKSFRYVGNNRITKVVISKRIEYDKNGKEYFAWYAHVTIKGKHAYRKKTNILDKYQVYDFEKEINVDNTFSEAHANADYLIVSYPDAEEANDVFCHVISCTGFAIKVTYPEYLKTTNYRLKDLKITYNTLTNKEAKGQLKKHIQRLTILRRRQLKSFINQLAKDIGDYAYAIITCDPTTLPKSDKALVQNLQWSYFIRKIAKECYGSNVVILVDKTNIELFDIDQVFYVAGDFHEHIRAYVYKAAERHIQWLKDAEFYRQFRGYKQLDVLGQQDSVLRMNHPGNPMLKDKYVSYVDPWTIMVDKFGCNRYDFLPIVKLGRNYKGDFGGAHSFKHNMQMLKKKMGLSHPISTNLLKFHPMIARKADVSNPEVHYIKRVLDSKSDERVRQATPWMPQLVQRHKDDICIAAIALCGALWKDKAERTPLEEGILQTLTPAVLIRAKQWVNSLIRSFDIKLVPVHKGQSDEEARLFYNTEYLNLTPEKKREYDNQIIDHYTLNIDKYTFATHISPIVLNTYEEIRDIEEYKDVFAQEDGYKLYDDICNMTNPLKQKALLDKVNACIKAASMESPFFTPNDEEYISFRKENFIKRMYPQFRFEHPFETTLYLAPWLGLWIDLNILQPIGQAINFHTSLELFENFGDTLSAIRKQNEFVEARKAKFIKKSCLSRVVNKPSKIINNKILSDNHPLSKYNDPDFRKDHTLIITTANKILEARDEYVDRIINEEKEFKKQLAQEKDWYIKASSEQKRIDTLLLSDDPIRASRVVLPKLKSIEKKWIPHYIMSQEYVDEIYNDAKLFPEEHILEKDKYYKNETHAARTMFYSKKSYSYTIDRPNAELDSLNFYKDMRDLLKEYGCPSNTIFMNPYFDATNPTCSIRELMMSGNRSIHVVAKKDKKCDIYCDDKRQYTYYSSKELCSLLRKQIIHSGLTTTLNKMEAPIQFKVHKKIHDMLNTLYYKSIHTIAYYGMNIGAHTYVCANMLRHVKWFDHYELGKLYVKKYSIASIEFFFREDYDFELLEISKHIPVTYQNYWFKKFVRVYPFLYGFVDNNREPVYVNINNIYNRHQYHNYNIKTLRSKPYIIQWDVIKTVYTNKFKDAIPQRVIFSAPLRNSVVISFADVLENKAVLKVLGYPALNKAYDYSFSSSLIFDLITCETDRENKITKEFITLAKGHLPKSFTEACDKTLFANKYIVVSPYNNKGYVFYRNVRTSSENQFINPELYKDSNIYDVFIKQRDIIVLEQNAPYPKKVKHFKYNPIPSDHPFANVFMYSEILNNEVLYEGYKHYKSSFKYKNPVLKINRNIRSKYENKTYKRALCFINPILDPHNTYMSEFNNWRNLPVDFYSTELDSTKEIAHDYTEYMNEVMTNIAESCSYL